MLSLDLSPLGLLLAFAGGFVSFVSPCVLPLVPGYVAWVTGADLAQAQLERARTIRLGLLFVLGFSMVFVTLGAAATGFSGMLRRWSGEAAFVGGALVFLLGLAQSGLLRLPALLLQDLRPVLRLPSLTGGTPSGALLVGVAFAFGWTPCIGPVLGAILATSAIGAADGVVLLAAYSAGLGVPFLLAAFCLPFVLDRARRSGLGRFGAWLQQGSGVVVAMMGVALMTGELTSVAGWLLETFPALGRIG